MNRFEECLKFILAREGGYCNVVGDRGGATNYGITRATADRWAYQFGFDRVHPIDLTTTQIADIYLRLYWQPAGCEYLPAPLDLVVFDAAVNHGVGAAIKMLQRSLECTPDGIFGAITGRKAKECNARRIALAVIERRRDLYRSIVERDAAQAKFLNGWNNRIDILTTEISK